MQELKTSEDGYIRLTISEFKNLLFDDLQLMPDFELHEELGGLTANADHALLTGEAEWASKTKPVVSIGFGWYFKAASGYHLAQGPVGTNLMITDHQGTDIGWKKTSEYLLECAEVALGEMTKKTPIENYG